MPRPETSHARNGEARIAYQVLGEGPVDLVLVPGLVSHLALAWDDPDHARFLEGLARFSRLILFDKRGTGLSDRDKGVPGLETRMDDLVAVMEAAGASRVAIFGDSEGGMMSLLFAATHPTRVRGLALYGAFVHSPSRAWPAAQVEARFDLVRRAWGAATAPPTVAPSRAADQAFRRAWARFERQSASAATAAALLRIDRDSDITPALAAVRVPALLLHRAGDRRIAVANSRQLAAQLPAARYVELPGSDHLPYLGDRDRVIAEVERFVATLPAAAPPDRAFATLLALRAPAAAAAQAVRAELGRFGGRALRPDASLAAFDGPARAIRCGLAIAARLRDAGVGIAAGVHCGEVAAGAAVDDGGTLAGRIADAAQPGEVLVSQAVRNLVAGAGLRLAEHGAGALPGAMQPMPLFAASEA
ncbi:MAG TPA: alpha/beta fold hydrolase [Stellaceae bacterium]|nr:alpha/beta fold hydrolase [Stellaceae bacterium]